MARNISLDITKILLACMVVALHVGIFIDLNPVSYQITVNGLFRIAVPIFFIINGFFFIQHFLDLHKLGLSVFSNYTCSGC